MEVNVGETLTAPLTPLTAPSLVTADQRLGTPMGALGPRLTLMQASAMSRLTAPSGHRTALSLVFVKKQRNLDQLDLVNKSLLCSDDNSIGFQRFNNCHLNLRKLEFWILIGANDMSSDIS